MTDPKIILSHLPHFLQLAIFIAVSLSFKAIFSYEAPLTDVFAYKEHYESGNLCNWFCAGCSGNRQAKTAMYRSRYTGFSRLQTILYSGRWHL